MRLFIASDIDERIVRKITDIQYSLKKTLMPGEKVSWVKPPGIHLTFKFIGETPAAVAPGIQRCLQDAVSGISGPVPLSINGTGMFPGIKKPRVLWIGCSDSSGTLEKISINIETRLAEAGYNGDSRKFHPHLTVGRVHRLVKDSRLADEFLRMDSDFGETVIGKVNLYSSILKPGGAEYDLLFSAAL